MPTFEYNPDRLKQVEELLAIQYKKAHKFRTEIAMSSTNEKIIMELRLESEVLPRLNALEKERAEILSSAVKVEDISEEEAKAIIKEITGAIAHFEQNKPANPSKEIMRLLAEIHAKLDEPGKSASAKLKVSLPIIPLIASYEMEIDTEGLLTQVSRKALDLFKRLINKGL